MKKIYINGMQCEHCKKRVEKALLSIDNIKEVEVSLEEKCVNIKYNIEVEDSKIIETIENIGFEVIKIS